MSNKIKNGAVRKAGVGGTVKSVTPARFDRAVKTTVPVKKPVHPGGLGRGLDALIGRDAAQHAAAPAPSTAASVTMSW